MNDPHVIALHYRVIHDDSVDYDRAGPLTFISEAFRGEVKEGMVIFTMEGHFPTEDEARYVVDPFIEAWRIDAALRFRPGEFALKFERAEVVDRAPTPGVIHGSAAISFSIQSHATAHVGRGAYPSPPRGFAVSPAVEAMFTQYEAYQTGRMSLSAVAYFCLTVLTLHFGQEHGVKTRLNISGTVLKTIRQLSS